MVTILSKIFKINSIQVVGIFQDANYEKYTLLTFQKEKSKLNIVENKTFTSKELLLENINLKLPVILSIDGKGVLNKRIDEKNEMDVSWKKNIDFNSIFYTSYTNKNYTFMSFCRKDVVEEWLAVFRASKVEVIDTYIGSFLAILLAENLNTNIITSGNLAFELENNDLLNFSKTEALTETSFTISENTISNFALPLYGVGLHYFIQNDTVDKTEWKENGIDEVVYRKVFSTAGLIMLIGFFATLLISYFSIQHYASKNAELSIQNVYSIKAYQQIVTLEKQKNDKEEIINDSGFLSDKFLSFYSYEIIKSIPNSISLAELNVAPLQKVVKHNEKVEITPRTILVKGLTVSEDDFNDWLRNIKSFDWISKFEIESLKKDKKNNTQFSLKIIIK
jgi:Tfp pilus assembly protein PilN